MELDDDANTELVDNTSPRLGSGIFVQDRSSGSSRYLFIVHRGVLGVPCGPTSPEMPQPCIASALKVLERMVGVPYEFSSHHMSHVPIAPCGCNGVQFHVVGLEGLEGALWSHRDDWWELRAEQDVSEVLWMAPDEVFDFAIARPIAVSMYLPPVMGELFSIFNDPERPFPMDELTLAPASTGLEGDHNNEEQNTVTPHDGQQRARGLSPA